MTSAKNNGRTRGVGQGAFQCALAALSGLAISVLAASAGAQGWNVDLVGSCDTPGVAWDVYVVGDYAYVADCESGLHVIDVSDPAAPALVGTCDTPSCARAVCVDGWFAYVADWHSALQIVDVSTPFLPYILSACDSPGDEEDVFVAGDFAYVAGGVHGLHILDVGDLFQPRRVGTCALPGDADGVFVRGNLAYVACGAYFYDEGGLHIIDVTSPSHPTLLSSYMMPSYARDVQVVGSRAFVAAGFDGLQILDVSDPLLPTAVGTYDTLSSAQGLCVDGDLVYLTAFSDGLKVLDVSSPSSPTLRGVYEAPSPAVAVVVSGGLAYVACRQSGLLVLRFTDPQIPRELFVDDDAPNDPGPGDPTVSDPFEDGTPAHPFDAFQKAIDHARDSDTVTVLDGTYNGPGNLMIDYLGKAITVRSQNGPDNCIVDGQGNGTVFHVHRSEDERSVLGGFTICNGVGEYGGGGVLIDLSGLTVVDCVFVRNAAHRGGAIYSHFSQTTLVNCAFVENSVDDDGGAVTAIASDLSAVNCRFNGNTALMGGGIWCVETDLPLVNCTFHGNVARNGGGAICSNVESDILLDNCILWGDTALEGPEIAVYNDHWETHVTITHSDVEGSTAAIRSNAHTPFPVTWGAGSIDAPPLFVAPGHWDDSGTTDPLDDAWIDGNYELQSGSPCIDTGDNAALPPDSHDLDGDGDTSEPLPLDLGHKARVENAIVDMGAYEFLPGTPPSRLYVDEDAMGANDGTSWADAFNDLRDALELAAQWPGVVQEIWVAAGVYKPDRGSGDREATFQLVDGVAVYGGFAGVETELGQRDVATNETILSGDLAGDDGPEFANRQDNCYHVVAARAGLIGSVVRLDGFVITGGHADDSSVYLGRTGGGMVVEDRDITVALCTFRDNFARGGGGALYYRVSHLTLARCAFVGNSAGEFGGAVRNFESTGPLIDCVFLGNSADTGGAMHNDSSDTSLVNCLFSGNAAVEGAGGLYSESCGTTLVNCTFSANSSAALGGGMYSERPTTVTNCIFWANTDTNGTAESSQILPPIAPPDPSQALPVVHHSCIQGWSGAWGGTGNHGDDPLLVDPDGPDGMIGTADDNLRLSPASPCRDCGDNSALPPDAFDLDGDGKTTEPLPLDLDGSPRVLGVSVDMGAYETSGSVWIEATVCIHPRTLNLKSRGKWVTCWLELPAGYDPRDVDVASLRLNGTVAASSQPTAIGDHDEDGIPDLMVKFPRPEVIAILEVGESVEIVVTGKVGAEDFVGADTIRVIDPGIGPKSTAPGRPLEFSAAVLAEGLKGRVSYRAENLPPGATLDEGTGRFLWTPSAAQAGVYPNVTLFATDGLDEIAETIAITVAIVTTVRNEVWNRYR